MLRWQRQLRQAMQAFFVAWILLLLLDMQLRAAQFHSQQTCSKHLSQAINRPLALSRIACPRSTGPPGEVLIELMHAYTFVFNHLKSTSPSSLSLPLKRKVKAIQLYTIPCKLQPPNPWPHIPPHAPVAAECVSIFWIFLTPSIQLPSGLIRYPRNIQNGFVRPVITFYT